MNASYGAGLTKGAVKTAQYVQDRPERDARRARAALVQKQSEVMLEEFIGDKDLRQGEKDLRFAEIQQKTDQVFSTLLEDQSYRAFDSYETTGETRALNAFLTNAKRNPIGRDTFGNIARVDTLRKTPETDAQLARLGVTDPSLVYDTPELAKEYVLATTSDGSQVVMPMTKLYGTTRYMQFADSRNLASMKERAEYSQLLYGTENADTALIRRISETEGLSLYDATKKYFELKNTGKMSGSALERITEQIKLEFSSNGEYISDEDAMREARQRMMQYGSSQERRAGNVEDAKTAPGSRVAAEASFVEEDVAESRTTSTQRNVKAAEEQYAALDSLSGKDGATFMEADLSNPAVRTKAGKHIAALEQLSGKALTTEDKRVIRDARKLSDLGGSAGTTLTDEEAGIVDSMLVNVKKYITNDVNAGAEGTAAYETFRNTFRNALMGATLTPGETKYYEAAAGSMKQQLGPMLQQLKVQLDTVKSDIQSVYDMNDEYVAYYYLGKSRDDVDDVVRALEERISYFTDLETAQAKKYPVKPVQAVRPKVQPAGAAPMQTTPTETLEQIRDRVRGQAK